MTLPEALDEYRAILDSYSGLNLDDIQETRRMMKDLSVILSYLALHRDNYHRKWIGASMKYKVVAEGERRANEAIPERYMLRQIMNSGNKMLEVMRSNISYAKKEQ